MLLWCFGWTWGMCASIEGLAAIVSNFFNLLSGVVMLWVRLYWGIGCHRVKSLELAHMIDVTAVLGMLTFLDPSFPTNAYIDVGFDATAFAQFNCFLLTAGLTTPWPNCNFCGWGGVGWGQVFSDRTQNNKCRSFPPALPLHTYTRVLPATWLLMMFVHYPPFPQITSYRA